MNDAFCATSESQTSRTETTAGEDFLRWLVRQHLREDPIGDRARDLSDGYWRHGLAGNESPGWEARSAWACRGQEEVLLDAWWEFQNEID
jgi:hypothetical protein